MAQDLGNLLLPLAFAVLDKSRLVDVASQLQGLPEDWRHWTLGGEAAVVELLLALLDVVALDEELDSLVDLVVWKRKPLVQEAHGEVSGHVVEGVT